MIISGFDGLNIHLSIPAYEAKALRALLQQVDNNIPALATASKNMMLDGHPFTIDDIQAVSRQFVVALRKIATNIHEKPEPEDGAEAKPN